MSRGLGALQRRVKEVLNNALGIGLGALPFSGLRTVFVIENGGRPEDGDKLSEAQERSLKRALKGLVDRGEVLIVSGKGRPGEPRHYVTVERFAAIATGEVQDTTSAKRIFEEMAAKAEARLPDVLRRLGSGGQ